MQAVENDIVWTRAAAEWWNTNSYGLDADRAAQVMDTAREVADADDRRYICRNDLEAAEARVAG